MAGGITQQVLDKLDNVSTMVARIEERQINDSEDITELMKITIKGNGHLPLTQRTQKIEEWIDCEKQRQVDLRKETKEKKEKWSTRTWALFSGVLLYVLTNIIGIFFIVEKLK